jgi:signal transduction protein with GAF and PtsI domain
VTVEVLLDAQHGAVSPLECRDVHSEPSAVLLARILGSAAIGRLRTIRAEIDHLDDIGLGGERGEVVHPENESAIEDRRRRLVSSRRRERGVDVDSVQRPSDSLGREDALRRLSRDERDRALSKLRLAARAIE